VQGQQLVDWVADGNVIHPYSVPSPSSYQVDLERERRISNGIMVSFGSPARQIALQTRGLEDFRNIGFLVSTAANTGTDQTFRDAYNIIQSVTAVEMVSIGALLTDYVQEYYEAGWTLKDMTDIPFDYTADMYWPDHAYPPEPPPGYV
jgi:hypothetical protein